MDKRRRKIRRIKRIKKFMKFLVCVICIGVFIWQLAGAIKSDFLNTPKVIAEGKVLPAIDEDYTNIGVNFSNEDKTNENLTIEQQIYARNIKTLVLVNQSNPYNNEEVELVSISKGRLQVASAMYEDLKLMLSDASKNGYTYWLASGYRNWEKQQQLINEDVLKFQKSGMTAGEALAKSMKETALPGYSEHETGLALDILCSENSKMDISQEECLGNIWLQNHCCEYGFILRYPKDKEDITHISYEPWHFRYVGREAAEYITKNNLTLEEFYERINTSM